MSSFGFDFRNTSAYVTDPATCTYVTETDVYPTTRTVNGVSLTFGFVSGYSGRTRDRNNAIDARLAGMVFCDDATDVVFRVDLPASGGWTVRAALGDALNSGNNDVRILDNATELLQINGASTSGNFLDATKVSQSAANWPANNLASGTLTFSGTTCNVHGKFVVTDPSRLAHLFFTQVGGGAVATQGPPVGASGPGVGPGTQSQFRAFPFSRTTSQIVVALPATRAMVPQPGPGVGPFSNLQFSSFPYSNYIAPPQPLNPVIGSLGRSFKPGPGVSPSRMMQFYSLQLKLGSASGQSGGGGSGGQICGATFDILTPMPGLML